MTSLGKNARVAGFLYILASVVSVVRLLHIPKALFVHGNAAATANNIDCQHLRKAWDKKRQLVKANAANSRN
jgi:hypothetical protein